MQNSRNLYMTILNKKKKKNFININKAGRMVARTWYKRIAKYLKNKDVGKEK